MEEALCEMIVSVVHRMASKCPSWETPDSATYVRGITGMIMEASTQLGNTLTSLTADSVEVRGGKISRVTDDHVTHATHTPFNCQNTYTTPDPLCCTSIEHIGCNCVNMIMGQVPTFFPVQDL